MCSSCGQKKTIFKEFFQLCRDCYNLRPDDLIWMTVCHWCKRFLKGHVVDDLYCSGNCASHQGEQFALPTVMEAFALVR